MHNYTLLSLDILYHDGSMRLQFSKVLTICTACLTTSTCSERKHSESSRVPINAKLSFPVFTSCTSVQPSRYSFFFESPGNLFTTIIILKKTTGTVCCSLFHPLRHVGPCQTTPGLPTRDACRSAAVLLPRQRPQVVAPSHATRHHWPPRLSVAFNPSPALPFPFTPFPIPSQTRIAG